MQSLIVLLSFMATFAFASCGSQKGSTAKAESSIQKDIPANASKAYFASGCFWCIEIIYESVDGVYEAVSGYAGGHKSNPTYREVGSGMTGHAEALEVFYDPEVVSYETLVKVYYGTQNPTTFGQHPDYGDAYRSMIYYQNEEEKQIAESYKMSVAKDYKDPIVTEIVPFKKFWKAEEYHQDFERKNPRQSYVQAVSIPRLNRFKAKFPELLRSEK